MKKIPMKPATTLNPDELQRSWVPKKRSKLSELDNRQMQLDGEHTTCVELSRQVCDLKEELAQARNWAAAWKFCAKSLWVLSSRLAVFCNKHVPPESYGHMRDLPAGEQCPYCELAQARADIARKDAALKSAESELEQARKRAAYANGATAAAIRVTEMMNHG